MSAGCNALLKQGARVALCAEDILEVICPGVLDAQSTFPLGTTPMEVVILEHLANGLRDGEEIQRATGYSAIDMNTALTMLEINGAIRSLGANQWTIK